MWLKAMVRRFLKIGARGSVGRRLAYALLGIFSLATLLALLLLSQILSIQASAQINRQSKLFMDSMLAVREYTSSNVNPIVAPLNQEGLEFLPEAVPSYSATTVFANLKAKPEYSNYSYREATLNPTNLKDKSDTVETGIIEEFRTNPSLKIKEGMRSTPFGSFHYIAKPITISKQSCLACHSTPAEAPKSQILTYGANNGFGWKLNEIVGAQIVTVPIQEIEQAKRDSMLIVSGLLVLSFLTVGLLTNFILNSMILGPIRSLSIKADQASVEPGGVEFTEGTRSDEIGNLAKSFERMRQSLTISMHMLKNR